MTALAGHADEEVISIQIQILIFSVHILGDVCFYNPFKKQ
jgi:hypothetical protein